MRFYRPENHPEDSYLYGHHLIDEDELPNLVPFPYMYFNYVSEAQSTVDWQSLSSLIQTWMGPAMVKSTLQSTGTLFGLMASIGTVAPSMLSVMTCLSLFNIDIGSVRTKSNFSTAFSSVIGNQTGNDATVPYEYTNDEEYFFRQIRVDLPNEHIRRFMNRRYMFNSIGMFLASFLLFDKMRKLMPATEVENPFYWYQFTRAFDITRMAFNENLYYDTGYVRSNAAWMCPTLLNLSTSWCLRERGQYNNITYYVTPLSTPDKNAQNVLFRNSMPRLTDKYLGATNNWIAMCYRYLFYSQFSSLQTVNLFCQTLRFTSESHEGFNDYIFDMNQEGYEYQSENIPINASKVSWDTVPYILNNLIRFDTNTSTYNPIFIDLYNEIIATAEQVFGVFGNFMQGLQDNPCSIKGHHPFGFRDYKEIDAQISAIQSRLYPSPWARTSYIGKITDINSSLTSGVGYELMSPIVGGYLESGNLHAGFLTFYATSMANTQLHHSNINKIFSTNIDDLAVILKDNYNWTAGLVEDTPPQQDWQSLADYAAGTGGSLECVEEYLQVPHILSTFLPEQSMRGVFNKD